MAVDRRHLTCFKAYDIRGQVPGDLDLDLAVNIGKAFATFLRPKRVVVGRDIRLSSPDIAGAVMDGLMKSGADVVDIGVCGTEQVYFATFHLGTDGGVMVTASHNPKDYNGMKLVREEARPISEDTGLATIEQIILEESFSSRGGRGKVEQMDLMDDYIRHILEYVDRSALRPFRIVVNPGNGGAGPVLDRLEPHLPFRMIKRFYEPDGTFPNGVPNPLLPENRDVTAAAVRDEGANMGIAWDGDFDRCFLFDETGRFIEGYYIVGLLAGEVLKHHPGSRIVHDPRLTWNTIEVVLEAGGIPVQSKSGHAFMKEVMRREDAAYGGEMSAHHFFRRFSYCDSGMIPWMLVLQLMSSSGRPLSDLVAERMRRFPASGEINRKVNDPAAAIRKVKDHYVPNALRMDETDGVSIEFERWRFNLRPSNTEPLIRLNVESRGDEDLMHEKAREVLDVLERA